VDQEDQGDYDPPWWTRGGFYILLMSGPVLEEHVPSAISKGSVGLSNELGGDFSSPRRGGMED